MVVVCIGDMEEVSRFLVEPLDIRSAVLVEPELAGAVHERVVLVFGTLPEGELSPYLRLVLAMLNKLYHKLYRRWYVSSERLVQLPIDEFV